MHREFIFDQILTIMMVWQSLGQMKMRGVTKGAFTRPAGRRKPST